MIASWREILYIMSTYMSGVLIYGTNLYPLVSAENNDLGKKPRSYDQCGALQTWG